MVTLKSVDIWSETEKKVVAFDITLVEETDEGGNKSKVYLAKNGEEIHRFSPNITDLEIEHMASEINKEHE